MPKVSVVIPTYGKPLFLKKSIESVLSQTLRDWELFVVDDNDPDSEGRVETEKLMLCYTKNSQIHYIKHSHNKNGAAARNTGIAMCTGDFIAFLDSDDLYLPTRLEKCVAAMEKADDPLVGGVYSGCSFLRKGKEYYRMKRIKSGNFLVETLACTFPFCSGSNIFMKADIVRELKFDESFIRHQDYEFLARFFKKYSLQAIPEILIIKNNENINLPNPQKMTEVKEHYLKKFEGTIQTLPQDKQDFIYRSNYISILMSAARVGQKEVQREYYDKVISLGGISLKERLKLFAFNTHSMLSKH